MDPGELFNQIGIVQDRDILAELVMGQYDLAKRKTTALGCTKPEGWPSYASRKIGLIPTSADGTRENPSSLDAERPSQLQPYSSHQKWRRIGVSWWRGRICRASGRMLLRKAKWICKSCLFQTLGNLLGPIARLVSTEGLEKPKKKT